VTDFPRDAGRVVIVGGGLAGYSAATSLRSRGHTGSITVIDEEPGLYDRPPLSKVLFSDGLSIESLAFAPPAQLDESHIDVVTDHRVTAIDPDAASVTLDDGTVLPADTILIATGGRARRLAIPGGDLPLVHVLRSYSDAMGLRAAVAPGSRVVVIGAGLIGAELASSLVGVGAVVTLVDPAAVPIVPAVGQLMASYLHDMHTTHAVRVITGMPTAIEESASGAEVVLANGDRIGADVVVVGVGIVPNTELAEDAGLDVDNGIVVDSRQRTSASRVFAAGDVARRRSEDGELERREEHWEGAQLSGQAAAAGMLGLEPEARGAAWFWSDRHGVHLEAVGRLTGDGSVIVRGGGSHPTVFLVNEGIVVGAASIDDNNTVRAARRLIDQKVPVSEAELGDPSVSLRGLLRASR
jgi:NADPH-dependent 2,4-dienoyl-CoA reductase/sulfur reductase-like enzyme